MKIGSTRFSLERYQSLTVACVPGRKENANLGGGDCNDAASGGPTTTLYTNDCSSIAC